MAKALQEKKSHNAAQIALQGITLLLVLLLSLLILKNAVLEQLADSQSIYLDLTAQYQAKPEVLTHLADRDRLTGAMSRARNLYIHALDSFVLHTQAWIGLAEVLFDMGKKSQAVSVIQTLDKFSVEDPAFLWRKANLAYALNQNKILLSTLKKILTEDAKYQTRVFELAGSYWDDPDYLLKNFGKSYYTEILNYYIAKNKKAKVNKVWVTLEESGTIKPDTAITYSAFMMKSNSFQTAVAAWRKNIQKKGVWLYNGNFEKPILNTPFGWETTESDNVSLQYHDIGGGLTIQFDGTENSSFKLSQTIPLYPGDHIFQGFFETTNLTSQERPYWLISGYNCQGLYIQDTMLPPSEYKTEFAIPFHVPDSCEAIKLDLIRNKANPYDIIISGIVTLSDLQIKRLSPMPSIQNNEVTTLPHAEQPAPSSQKDKLQLEAKNVVAIKPEVKTKSQQEKTTLDVFKPQDITIKTTININRLVIKKKRP